MEENEIIVLTAILVGICWIFASACNAVMDVLSFKFKTSIFKNLNDQYWNPAKSWRNKYKNKIPSQGPAFILSTTALSFLTDAWHLFQFLSNSFLALSVVIVFQALGSFSLETCIIMFISLKLIWGLTFEPLYGTLFRRMAYEKT